MRSDHGVREARNTRVRLPMPVKTRHAAEQDCGSQVAAGRALRRARLAAGRGRPRAANRRAADAART